ncbi:MAG TPA: hypothetical protein PKK26_07985 [Candidatus Wallbacteria bacterium]|nr:hypothetical protein [Candidatus Wallbacteria bacterium]
MQDVFFLKPFAQEVDGKYDMTLEALKTKLSDGWSIVNTVDLTNRTSSSSARDIIFVVLEK